MLEIKDLSVSYGHVKALKNVSLKADDGEIISIIGSNGAGKTSLLGAISAIVKAKHGDIIFNGEKLPSHPHLVVQKGIIQVPEGRKTFSGLTIQDNLLTGGYRFSNRINKEDLKKQYELFPILAERKFQFAGTLSGGEQQMLAISRSLMSHPKLLLLDEPSLGLAPLIVEQVFKIIKDIQESGISILLVEQNAKKALGLCDRAYVLENGEIKTEGTGKELLNSDIVRQSYLGS